VGKNQSGEKGADAPTFNRRKNNSILREGGEDRGERSKVCKGKANEGVGCLSVKRERREKALHQYFLPERSGYVISLSEIKDCSVGDNYIIGGGLLPSRKMTSRHAGCKKGRYARRGGESLEKRDLLTSSSRKK